MEQALDDGDAEEAGFWLQQALEKYLKAFLLSRGWVLRKIHDLEVLLNEARAHLPAFGGFGGACRRITGYYLAERYPFVAAHSIEIEEVSRSRDEIRELVQTIRQELQ